MTTATAGDYATLSDALRAATGQLSGSPQSAHTAAAEAAAQLWHQQDGILTDPQVSTICHAARVAAEHSSTTLHQPPSAPTSSTSPTSSTTTTSAAPAPARWPPWPMR